MNKTYATLVVAAVAALLASCGREDAETVEASAAPVSGAPAAVTPATVLSSRPETRAFRDWKVVCDNGAACIAIAPSTESDQGWLRLAMAAESGAAPELTLGFWAMGETPTPGTTPLVLTVDGRTFRTERIAGADQPTARVVGPDAVAAVRALAAGKAATLSAGSQSIGLSLTGAAASLLWIDEHQGRLETPNALVRVGEKPASTRPPELPLVVAAAAVDQGRLGEKDQVLPKTIETLAAVRACRQETSFNEYVQKAVFSARLGPQQELWSVPCFSGAYNLGSDLYVTGPNGQNPVVVALPQGDGTTDKTVVNAGYDPAIRTLSAFNKGRGIGDCGILQTWVWTGRGFALTLEQQMTDCLGLSSDFWPTVWRARTS